MINPNNRYLIEELRSNNMANIQALTRPVIYDREALGEFADSLADHAPSIERDMSKLSKEPNNRVVVADIFRALHNIKGDAALCRVEVAGMIAHPIESLLTRLRSGEARYTPLLGEVILLAVDRLELTIEALVAGKTVEHLKLVPLVEGLEKMSSAAQADLDPLATQLIKSVTGFQPQSTLRDSVGKLPAQEVQELPITSKGSMTFDLQFFQSLAMQFEARSPLFKGRTDRIRRLALDTNRSAGSPVDAIAPPARNPPCVSNRGVRPGTGRYADPKTGQIYCPDSCKPDRATAGPFYCHLNNQYLDSPGWRGRN